MCVLKGEKITGACDAGGGKGSFGEKMVVPSEVGAATSVLLLINSHGNIHPAHSKIPEHDEWFFHFPHPAP